MKVAVAAMLLLVGMASAWAQGGDMTPEAEPMPGLVSLDLSRVPKAGEMIELSVRTGPLALGTVLRLSTVNGVWSTALTPFGIRSGTGDLAFQVAVPAAAITGTRIDLMAKIAGPGTALRAATATELRGVSVLGE